MPLQRDTIIFIVFSLTLLAFNPSIYAEQKVEPLASISGADSPLKMPVSIFLDRVKKRIYIADAEDNSLLLFSDELRYLAKFTNNNQLLAPTSLIKDLNGKFYVVEGTRGRVMFFDIKAKLSKPILLKGLEFPGYLALGPGGKVYLADRVTGRIFIMTDEASLNDEIQISLKGMTMTDLWIGEGGKIYIADPIARKVHIFNQKGGYFNSFGKKGKEEGEFLFPVSVCTGYGKIFVADSHRHKILIFDSAGRFLHEFGREGFEEGMLNYPIKVRVDWQRRIFVINRGTRKVEVFRLSKD